METGELATKRTFTSDEALAVASTLGIDFTALGCDLEQFRMGLDVELEHGTRDPETDVNGDDSIVTGKIALAHLTEFPDYYTRLAVLERERPRPRRKKQRRGSRRSGSLRVAPAPGPPLRSPPRLARPPSGSAALRTTDVALPAPRVAPLARRAVRAAGEIGAAVGWSGSSRRPPSRRC